VTSSERAALCGDHLKVTSDAAFLTRHRKIERALGGRDCFVLNLGLVFQNSDSGQIVFDPLESSQHVLPISSDLVVISRTRLIVDCTASSGIEDRTHGRRSNRPQIARPAGVFMMSRVRTIFFPRNPYLFSDMTWGMMYVLHGMAGVGLIALIMVHVYFGIRPEKRPMTKSMIFGWMSRDFYLQEHDPSRWVIKIPASSQAATGAKAED
jgi:hypothetical protein